MTSVIILTGALVVMVIALVALVLTGSISFACKHKILTEVQEDGRQYCTVCNKAFVPECPHTWEMISGTDQRCTKCGLTTRLDPLGCDHYWEKKGENTITNAIGNTSAIISILRCKKCGDMKKFTVTSTEEAT